jgi:hypothetical protein
MQKAIGPIPNMDKKKKVTCCYRKLKLGLLYTYCLLTYLSSYFSLYHGVNRIAELFLLLKDHPSFPQESLAHFHMEMSATAEPLAVSTHFQSPLLEAQW